MERCRAGGEQGGCNDVVVHTACFTTACCCTVWHLQLCMLSGQHSHLQQVLLASPPAMVALRAGTGEVRAGLSSPIEICQAKLHRAGRLQLTLAPEPAVFASAGARCIARAGADPTGGLRGWQQGQGQGEVLLCKLRCSVLCSQAC